MKIFSAVLLFTLLSLPAFSKGIDPAHQNCEKDLDCKLVTIGCGCIHNSTCMGPEDKANGFVDGVNKKFAAQYDELSKCSASETRSCSMAGPCAKRGEWLPKCEKKQCTLVFKSSFN